MPRTKKTTEEPKAEKKTGRVKAEKKEYVFSVQIDTSGTTYKSAGDSLYELFLAFPTPSLFNTETNIIVTKGGKTVQKDLKCAEARRCFTGYDTTSLQLLAIGISKMLP